jgi:hypothetical protein
MVKVNTVLQLHTFGIKPIVVIILLFVSACSSDRMDRTEEIRVPTSDSDQDDTTHLNSIRGNVSLAQISSEPNSVVLTGLSQHRLVTVYRTWPDEKGKAFYEKRSYYDGYESDRDEHFMPGIDLIYGYNLINVAHYDLIHERLDYLFDHPVLIKSLYYPSFEQDSIDEKPIIRDYYLVSVYDEDTNSDTLLNKNDLRRLYYFNVSATEKNLLIPADYSVVRSQYDPKNDVMYIFARQDTNHDGASGKNEPLHVFWLRLQQPEKAKRLY